MNYIRKMFKQKSIRSDLERYVAMEYRPEERSFVLQRLLDEYMKQ